MKDKIKLYLEIKDELGNLASEIFQYIKENFIGLLAFGKYSAYDGWKVKGGKFSIKHFDRGYDIYEYSYFQVPLKRVYEGTWKEYIQEQEEKRIEKYCKKQIEEEKLKRERELKILKELKEKYENN